MGIMEGIRAWNEPLIDEHAKTLGAECESASSVYNRKVTDVIDVRANGVWDDYHVVDGRIVSGQNPQSATSTAKAAVQVFDQL